MTVTRRTFLAASGALGALSRAPFSPTAEDEASDVTRGLARYVVASRWPDVPERAQNEAVRSMVNWVGCALGGALHQTVDSDLEAKFRGQAQAVLSEKQMEELLSLCWSLPSLPDAGAIARKATTL
jgi:hypothetical protein